MGETPLPDPTQQPITADDTRVAKILAIIQAQQQQNPVATTDIASQATIPQQAAPPPLPPQGSAPPLQLSGGPAIAPQLPANAGPPPPVGDLAQMPSQQPQMPQIAPPPAQGATQVPQSQPGPVKSFLMQLGAHLASGVQAGSDSLLHSGGVPTAYDKQQNALKMGLQQQQQNSLEGLRQSQQDLYGGKLDQLQSQLTPTQIPNDPKYGAFAGATMPMTAASAVMQKMEALQNAKDIASGKNQTTIEGKQIQYGPGSYLRRGVRSVGGRIISFDKGDPTNPDLTQDMGADTSMITGPRNADARAQAMAKYRTFDTTDTNGAPVTISGLDALQGGAAHVPYTQAKGILSDKVGVQQYQDILDNKIAPNLAVLNDNSQRIAIAHTLSEVDKNPGALQAVLTSAIQNGALTPQGAQLTAGIMQAREFGGVARKYGGNMNGTEGLMNRIMSNQASPLNSLQLNQDLVANDRAFTQKALTNIGILQGHTAQGKTGPPNIAPGSTPAAPPIGATHIVRGPDGKNHYTNAQGTVDLGVAP
jgi:hypothetical protein